MKIHEAMQVTGLTKKAAYYYEVEGLVSPEKDQWNNYRDYSEEDIRKLVLISILRRLDFPMGAIRRVLINPGEIRGAMERQRAAIAEKIDSLNRVSDVIEEFVTKLEGSNMSDELTMLHKRLDLDPRKPGFMLKELDRVFPGNLGKLIAVFYGQFLDEPLDNEEKIKAWEELVDRLDAMEEIEYPAEIKRVIDLYYGRISDDQLLKMSQQSRETVDKVLARQAPPSEQKVAEVKKKLEEYANDPRNAQDKADFAELQQFVLLHRAKFKKLDSCMEILSKRFRAYSGLLSPLVSCVETGK